MTTFYDPDCHEGSRYLPEIESKHALKSLRIRINEEFDIINGKGLVLHVSMVGQRDDLLEYRLNSAEKKERKLPRLHVAISPLKQSDRLEYFVEKATELGIDEISPIRCIRTEKPKIKEERIQRIITSAIKQSGNPFMPTLNPIQDFGSFIESNKAPQMFIGHCEDGNKLPLPSLSFDKDTLILIGPEGDFTDEEVALALKNKYLALSLGELTLRTETAALTVCAYFQMNKYK